MSVHDDIAALAALVPGARHEIGRFDVQPGFGRAASAFDVDRLLAASAGYWASGTGAASIDLDHVRSFCTTHVEVDGSAVPGWAPLSGVYATRDGRHLQIHCNFPHHADAVCSVLATSAARDAVAAAIAERDADELEIAVNEAGGIAATIRTLDEWDAHPHAAATASLPTIGVQRLGDAPPCESDTPPRVLDCSRVLAGPVAGQLLATDGADVLRLGAAHLPTVDVGVISTGFGKRNADLDLRNESGRATMDALLAGADIWIDAFRPGALAEFGFTPEHAATVRPGIVVVQISAFDWVGPWAGRRGFDSIVQSTTGVRWAGGEHAVDPNGAAARRGPIGLPVQALDYATGFIAAGVATQLLRYRRDAGGSWLARVSLLRTRNWLVSMGGPDDYVPAPLTARTEDLATIDSDFGRVTAVTPFVGEWPHPPRALGSSAPTW